MHQPLRLPDLNHSRPVVRGSGLSQQQDQKSSASTSAPSKSIAVGASNLQQQQVRQLHSYASVPVWLRSLLAAQKVSKVLFVSVFGLSLLVYGQTMHTQTTWRTLEDQLRRGHNQERQQGIMNENLKQELATTAASKASGLVDPKPQMAVFIPAAPLRQPKSLPAQAQTPTSPPVSKVPSGY